MGLTDKFKTLAKQAQDAVAEHADKLHEAVDTVGVTVNEKTQGKYANKIAKVGEKTGSAIDKFGGVDPASSEAETSAESTASAEQPYAQEPAEPPHAEQPAEPPHAEQPAEPPHAEQPPEPPHAEQPPEPRRAEQPPEQPTPEPAGGSEFPSFDE